MFIFQRPGRIGLDQGDAFFRWSTTGQDAGALGESARSPFAKRFNMRRTFFGKHVGIKVISPAEQRHFKLQYRERQGNPKPEFPPARAFEGKFTDWNQKYQLILGGSANGRFSWLGTYRLVAIYDRAITAEEVRINHEAGTEK